MTTRERLAIGVILRAHGVRGLVRVRAGAALASLRRVFVGGRSVEVVRAMPERGDWLVELEGVGDRDQANMLRGMALEAPRSELPPPAEGEWYAADLVGLSVYDAAGILLGVVGATYPSGAHEILEVRREGRGELLLPLVDAIVTRVDVAAGRIDCDPPEGLLDLDLPGGAGPETPEGGRG